MLFWAAAAAAAHHVHKKTNHQKKGDGVFLPRTSFKGVAWVRDIHSEWFGQYTHWTFALLEVASGPAAAAGAKKGFTDAFGFFHWSANNTGAYRGLPPTGCVLSCSVLFGSVVCFMCHVFSVDAASGRTRLCFASPPNTPSLQLIITQAP